MRRRRRTRANPNSDSATHCDTYAITADTDTGPDEYTCASNTDTKLTRRGDSIGRRFFGARGD